MPNKNPNLPKTSKPEPKCLVVIHDTDTEAIEVFPIDFYMNASQMQRLETFALDSFNSTVIVLPIGVVANNEEELYSFIRTAFLPEETNEDQKVAEEKEASPDPKLAVIEAILEQYDRVAGGDTDGAGGCFYADEHSTLNAVKINVELLEELAKAYGRKVHPRDIGYRRQC